jgi:hypothetical protein
LASPKNRPPIPILEDDEPESVFDGVVSHMLRQAPWRDVMADGRLGPWHGPRTAGERARWQSDYEDTREAGSLWDWEQVPERYRPRTTWQSRGVPNADRYDAVPMAKYLRLYSAAISMRQLEVYSLYYLDGYSLNRVAGELGITPNTARNHIKQLRAGLREWLAKCA